MNEYQKLFLLVRMIAAKDEPIPQFIDAWFQAVCDCPETYYDGKSPLEALKKQTQLRRSKSDD